MTFRRDEWPLRRMLLLSHSVMSDSLCDPVDCSPPGSSVLGTLQQEPWSGLPFPPPADLPGPGTELGALGAPALAGAFFTAEPLGQPP